MISFMLIVVHVDEVYHARRIFRESGWEERVSGKGELVGRESGWEGRVGGKGGGHLFIRWFIHVPVTRRTVTIGTR